MVSFVSSWGLKGERKTFRSSMCCMGRIKYKGLSLRKRNGAPVRYAFPRGEKQRFCVRKLNWSPLRRRIVIMGEFGMKGRGGRGPN